MKKKRECGHERLAAAGICELCDVDWLAKNEGRKGFVLIRKKIVREIQREMAANREGGSDG